MKEKKAVCKHCGSTDFYIDEYLLWKAYTDDVNPKVINCFVKDNRIDTIHCKKCNRDITADLDTDEFEFDFQ